MLIITPAGLSQDLLTGFLEFDSLSFPFFSLFHRWVLKKQFLAPFLSQILPPRIPALDQSDFCARVQRFCFEPKKALRSACRPPTSRKRLRKAALKTK